MRLEEKEVLVLIKMAENGPISGYDIHHRDRLHLMSNPHWQTVREKLLSVNRIKSMPKRGRAKPFWLTEEGIADALAHGANLDKTRRQAQRLLAGEKLNNALLLCHLAEKNLKKFSAMVNMIDSKSNGGTDSLKIIQEMPELLDFVTTILDNQYSKQMLVGDEMQKFLKKLEMSGTKIQKEVKKLRP